MRKFVILILFIFISLPCIANDVLYLNEKWDNAASKNLYEHELRELNVTPEKAHELFGFKQSDVRAVFYDLNADGVNEVIGYVDTRYYYGVLGWSLFILRKNNNSYVNISSINFYPEKGLHIFKNKLINGYYELGFYEDLNRNFKKLKYNNN